MDTNRIKQASDWFFKTIYQDEPITPRASEPSPKLPPLLLTARSLANTSNNAWQSRESVFLKQAKLLANYEDNYLFEDNVVRYFPTYQSLTDKELRGYFSWRTQLRKGNIQKTSLSFAFLYIYELLNQIGTEDPLDGYSKLISFRDVYSTLDKGILYYLDKWLLDYVIYYELDPALLAETPRIRLENSIAVLDRIHEQDEESIISAVKTSAPSWLSRSKFYTEHQPDFNSIIVRVLRKVSNHYATRTQRTMTEQFFGRYEQCHIQLFESAVFCDPLRKQNCTYILDNRCIYQCVNGLWSVTRHTGSASPSSKLESILKTIDAVMREEYQYKHPVKYGTDTKWLLKFIREEVETLLTEKKALEAKKITIDYSQLARIRQEAEITQEKLTVDEELEDPCLFEPVQSIPTESPPASEPVIQMSTDTDSPLNDAEYRLLHCLLYNGSISWVQTEGHMMSVLVDSINEKLYDTFMDSVLDDTPELIEDYIDELKEVVKP